MRRGAGLRALLALVLATCVLGSAGAAENGEILPVTEVASGVFVIPGGSGEATPENLGRVINTGFIIGDDAVVVIDSGANQRHGLAILATIASTTDKPIRLLINTHPNPSYVLGNSAFAARGIPILASGATADAMLERCPRCIASLTELIGEAAMRGTEITQAQQRIDRSQALELAGRRIVLLHVGHARTEGDLAVFDASSGTLFAGDLVVRGQIQHFAEARFSGWITALQGLEQLPVKILVPGRGDVGDASALLTMRRYLTQLHAGVGAAYQGGRSADEALGLSEVPEFLDWRGYAKNHPLNVQRSFFEHEADDLAAAKQAPQPSQ